MLIHCDNCGKKCTTLYQTVLYGDNCGIFLRVDPTYHESNFCKLLMNGIMEHVLATKKHRILLLPNG